MLSDSDLRLNERGASYFGMAKYCSDLIERGRGEDLRSTLTAAPSFRLFSGEFFHAYEKEGEEFHQALCYAVLFTKPLGRIKGKS